MIAFDTETTGLDLYHGAEPFFVTVCKEDGEVLFWEWPVDPMTRRPKIPAGDLEEIKAELELVRGWGKFDQEVRDRHCVVGQNIKFDAEMVGKVIPGFQWPWEMTHDTIISGHILGSNLPHNLTAMAAEHLGRNIYPLEQALHECVEKCRRIVQQSRLRRKRARQKKRRPSACQQRLLFHDYDPTEVISTVEEYPYADWRIAEKDLEDAPSAKSSKESAWKFDMWLPKAVALREGYRVPDDDCDHEWDSDGFCDRCNGHRYHTVLRDYSNADSAITLALWQVMSSKLKGLDLWEIYLERVKLVRIASDMQIGGVTYNSTRADSLGQDYEEENEADVRICSKIASDCGYDLDMPHSGNNESLLAFCFGEKVEDPTTGAKNRIRGPSCLNLPIVGWTDTGAPSLDKDCLDRYLITLRPNSKEMAFVKSLRRVRKRTKSVEALCNYRRFALPYLTEGKKLDLCFMGGEGLLFDDFKDWYVLHPSVNITGTNTLRWSFSNPNSSNVSKQPDEAGFTLRYCFGPAPGREWYTCDAQNIELRIPAFEAEEEVLMDVFLHPKKPPYFGSYHLVVFDVLHPKLFAKHGKDCKELFDASWYQWVKNGNFAVIYGAQEDTADATYHVKGAFKKIRSRFPKIARLNDRMIAYATKYGYVETIPDKTVNPRRGYPLLCTKTEFGKILPTVPLNYHVQGTAMWWMARAMVRCHEQLLKWRQEDGFDGRITLQVHDELAFDFPRLGDPVAESKGLAAERSSNLWRIRTLRELMAKGGEGIGVPTPVSCKYHASSWKDGIAV